MTNHSSPDLTNKLIDGYSILHRLGVGGMSEVYLAFQQSLHRHVALKVMRSDYVGLKDHEQRFLQEARAAAGLVHPNIVQVYDVGTFESVHYIAQEYVPGSNLHAYIQRHGALPLAESLSILWQATSALQKAATVGLVHRDIKPDNLLLTPNGEVKIADFGLARALGQEQNLTVVGVALGTPLYMSPEQVQGLPVDARSDLYSLGATAYHMLAGRPPFSGDTPLALAMQHVQAKPLPLEELRPDVPKSLVAIVHRLLEKSPSDRFESAAALASSLRGVVDREMAGKLETMVPFRGLVTENREVSNLAATQALQALTNTAAGAKGSSRAKLKSRLLKIAACLLVGSISMGIVYGMSYRDVFRTQLEAEKVVRQETVERQYALALLENDLPHWNAVSLYFNPEESSLNENYHYKSLLQIARKHIEVGNYKRASEVLAGIYNSRSHREIDPVIETIVQIEMGWLETKLGIEVGARPWWVQADRTWSGMRTEPEKKRLILDSLPKGVSIAWEQHRTGTE